MKITKTAKLPQQATFIGRATATPVPSLSDGPAQSAQLLALGNVARAPGQPTLAQLKESCQQSPLSHLDFLMAGTDCDLDKLLETVTRLKELHPQLKLVLANSAEAPSVLDPPLGVESVMQVCQAKAQAGRCLLSQQAGILAGTNAGMAAYVSFVMGARMESGVTIAMATTNLSPELLGL